MKHCPTCDFSFEDPENFCDFDGTQLVADPEPRLPSCNFSPRPSLPVRLLRSHVSLALLVLAGVMSSALLVGYYDSASQAGSNSETLSNAKTREAVAANAETRETVASNGATRDARDSSRSLVNPVPPAQAWAEAKAESVTLNTPSSRRKITASENSSSIVTVRRTLAPRSRAQFRARFRSAGFIRNETRESENAHQKKESKVTSIFKKTGSILKTTGRLLKKPFDL